MPNEMTDERRREVMEKVNGARRISQTTFGKSEQQREEPNNEEGELNQRADEDGVGTPPDEVNAPHNSNYAGQPGYQIVSVAGVRAKHN